MKVADFQIKELYSFTRRRLVEHYDLQTELVDHLANGIEQQWDNHPERSFNEALKIEFSKFGHFGFRGVIKERKKAIGKTYKKIVWLEIKSFYTFPKFVYTLVSSILVFLLIQNLPQNYKWPILSVTMIVLWIIFLLKSLKNKRKYRVKIGIKKRWLLEEKLMQTTETSLLFLNLFHVFNMMAISNKIVDSTLLDAVATLVLIFCFISSYVIIFILPQGLSTYLNENYPEYRLVNKQWV